MRRRALVGLLLAALGSAVPQATAVPTWLPAVDVSAAGTFSGAPVVAVDPAGNITAAWVRTIGNDDRAEVATRPAGALAFGPPEAISPAGSDVSSVGVVAGADGSVSIAWTLSTGGGYVGQIATRLAGASFGPPQDLTGPSAPSSFGVFVRLAADETGTVTVVWSVDTGTAGQVQVSTREPGAVAFGGPTTVSSPGEYAVFPDVVSSAVTGTTVAWVREVPSLQNRVVAVNRPAGAAAFGSPELVSTPGSSTGAPRLVVDASGEVTGVWLGGGGVESARRPPGGPFAALETLSNPGFGSLSPSLGVDAQGNATAVWVRTEGSKYVVQVADRPPGQRFGVPVDISAPVASIGAPSVARDVVGGTVVAWGFFSDTEGYAATARVRGPGAAGFGAPLALSTLSGHDSRAVLSDGGAGDPSVAWIGATVDPATAMVRSRVLDGSGPVFSGVSVPATGGTGAPVPMSVVAADRWSQPASISWDFGDGTSASGLAVSHLYRAPGTFQVHVTATDPHGNTSTLARTLPVADTVRPVLKKTSLKPRRFTAKKGSRLRLTLSEAATVKGRVAKASAGRVGGRCEQPSPGIDRHDPCIRWLRKAKLWHLSAGASKVRFTGRVGRLMLKPGLYEVVLTATDSAGNRSAPKKLRFRVLRPGAGG